MKQVVTVTLNPAIDKTVTVKQFEIGTLNRVESESNIQIDPGGKGINVAKVLNNFNVNVLATGLIAGKQGQQLLSQLEERRLKQDFLKVQGETRTNLKIVDQETRQLTELNEPGFTVAEGDVQRFLTKLTDLFQESSILVLGGSYPKGIRVDIYQQIISLANEHGVKVILDADGEAFKEGLKAKPYAVKPNVYELELLLGRSLPTDQDILEAGKELLNQGITMVVISMGQEGSIILNEKEAYLVSALSITPGSTVGAGDSMVAAMVFGILEDLPLADLAKWANAAGGVTASKPGTEVCSFGEVKEVINQVKISKLI